MPTVTHLGIDPAKVVEYLLNLDHVEGGSKAKFFLSRGFDRSRPQEFAGALVNHATARWPGEILGRPGATRFRIVGPIWCPDDSTPDILTIWQAALDSNTALLVTARPQRGRKLTP